MSLVTDVLFDMPSRPEKGSYVIGPEMVRREGEIRFTPFGPRDKRAPKDDGEDRDMLRDIA